MTNYHEELRIRRNYMGAVRTQIDGPMDVQEDIATRAVLRAYLEGLVAEDAILASIPPRPTESDAVYPNGR